MLHTAASSDNPGMGPTTRSETAAAEPDPSGLESEGSDLKPADKLRIQPELPAIDAGLGTATLGQRPGPDQLLTIQSDMKELEALPEPDVSDTSDAVDASDANEADDASEVTAVADEISRPFAAPEPTPTPPADLGLSKLVTLPAWSWRKRAAAAREVQQALDARVAEVRRETDAAHAAQIVVWEAQAAERLETTRRDAEAALTTLTTELAAEATARVKAAVRETRDKRRRRTRPPWPLCESNSRTPRSATRNSNMTSRDD